MRIRVESLPQIMAEFIDKELIPKGTVTQKFFTALLGAAISKQIPSIVEHYRPFLEMIHVMEGDTIDFDAARDILTETFAKVPNVTLSGIVFDINDVNTLYQLAKRYS